MATITGLTAERMQEIIDATIVDADIVGDNLILTKQDASTIDVGNVRGPVGPEGPEGPPGSDPTGADISDLYANRPAASSLLNGIRFFAIDKLMEWECEAASWVLIHAYAPRVTGLPASPVDGQECKFVASATNGVVWHLCYNASSASVYKWEFVGGPELSDLVAADQATASTDFTDLTTVGPTVTSPLAGEYTFEIFSHVYRPSTSGNAVGIKLNGAGAGPATGPEDGVTGIYAAGATHQITKKFKKTTTAAQDMVMKYATGTANTTDFYNRRVSMIPVRVG